MTDGTHAAESDGGSAPMEGYDRLKPHEVKKALSSHTQNQLEDIERYERANKKRPAILDKLRFMRGRQPLPGYDQLSPEEIGVQLGEADIKTIKGVRDYERKFANRPEVLEETTRVHRLQRGDKPLVDSPSSAPTSSEGQ